MGTSSVQAYDGVRFVAPGLGPAASAPGAPAFVTVTPLTTQVTATVSAPTTDGGSVITSYSWVLNPGAVPASTPGRTVTFTGLTPSSNYSLAVNAVNAVGPGPAVSQVFATGAVSTSGKPDATNTGCRIARASLIPIDGGTIGNQIRFGGLRRISGYLITGSIDMYTDACTFVDNIFEADNPNGARRFWFIMAYQTRNSIVQYCSFDGMGGSSFTYDQALVMGPGWVVEYCHVKGCDDGVKVGTSGYLRYNYIHGNRSLAASHSDGIQMTGGPYHWGPTYIVGNNIDVTDHSGPINSVFELGAFTVDNTNQPGVLNTVDGLYIWDNWFNGGGWTINGDFGSNVASVANVSVLRNKFGLGCFYGAVTGWVSYWHDPSNVWELTGTTTGGKSVTAGSPVA